MIIERKISFQKKILRSQKNLKWSDTGLWQTLHKKTKKIPEKVSVYSIKDGSKKDERNLVDVFF